MTLTRKQEIALVRAYRAGDWGHYDGPDADQLDELGFIVPYDATNHVTYAGRLAARLIIERDEARAQKSNEDEASRLRKHVARLETALREYGAGVGEINALAEEGE